MITPIQNIAIVAPSGIFNPTRLELGIDLLKEWGIESRKSPNLYSKHLFTAGTVQERLADLRWALSEPDVDAIFFARGGYGTSQLLPFLDLSTVATRPIFGFSDATALLCHVYNHKGGPFVHAPVLHSLADLCNTETQQALRKLLVDGTIPTLTVEHCYGPLPDLQAPITGGNLCVLTTLIGTPWQLKTKGCILLLEDVGEPPYKIHRMLLQLKLAGMLSEVKAIVLGEFLQSKVPSHADWTLKDCYIDVLADLDIPIMWNSPFGHHHWNLPWVAGEQYNLSATQLKPVGKL